MTKYNGWKNYETWNQALWMSNDENYYSLVQDCKDYIDFVLRLKYLGEDETPDKVTWGVRGSDLVELEACFKELKNGYTGA